MHKIEIDLLNLTNTCGMYKRPYIILLPTFVVEWKGKFMLEVSEHNVVISASPPEICPWTPG